jgi:hypothetical protein
MFMKRVCLILLALSVAFNVALSICLWQARPHSEIIKEEHSTTDERHLLDISFEATMSDLEVQGVANNRRDVSMLYGDKWREEMERYLELMRNKLDEDALELVATSQSNWEVFVESDMELFSRAISQAWAGGNAIGEFIAFRRYQTYRERTLHLIRMHEYLMTEWVDR